MIQVNCFMKVISFYSGKKMFYGSQTLNADLNFGILFGKDKVEQIKMLSFFLFPPSFSSKQKVLTKCQSRVKGLFFGDLNVKNLKRF